MSQTRRPALLDRGNDLGDGGDVAAREDIFGDPGLVTSGPVERPIACNTMTPSSLRRSAHRLKKVS